MVLKRCRMPIGGAGLPWKPQGFLRHIEMNTRLYSCALLTGLRSFSSCFLSQETSQFKARLCSVGLSKSRQAASGTACGRVSLPPRWGPEERVQLAHLWLATNQAPAKGLKEARDLVAFGMQQLLVLINLHYIFRESKAKGCGILTPDPCNAANSCVEHQWLVGRGIFPWWTAEHLERQTRLHLDGDSAWFLHDGIQNLVVGGELKLTRCDLRALRRFSDPERAAAMAEASAFVASVLRSDWLREDSWVCLPELTSCTVGP